MKYRFLICACGRIHIIPNSWLNWAMESHHERCVVQICTNCGRRRKMFFEAHESGLSLTLKNIDDGICNGTMRLCVHSGITVPMMTGKVADTYYNGFFINNEDWGEHEDASICNAYKAKESWITVDGQKLIEEIQQTYNDAKDILSCLSSCFINI